MESVRFHFFVGKVLNDFRSMDDEENQILRVKTG